MWYMTLRARIGYDTLITVGPSEPGAVIPAGALTAVKMKKKNPCQPLGWCMAWRVVGLTQPLGAAVSSPLTFTKAVGYQVGGGFWRICRKHVCESFCELPVVSC